MSKRFGSKATAWCVGKVMRAVVSWDTGLGAVAGSQIRLVAMHPTLLNGNALRRVGRSTVVELWGRCGLANFLERTHCGTAFVCMQRKRVADVCSAGAVSREGIGSMLMRFLDGGGASLDKALAGTAISGRPVASSTWAASREDLPGLLGPHASVLHRDIPRRYWPSSMGWMVSKRHSICAHAAPLGNVPNANVLTPRRFCMVACR